MKKLAACLCGILLTATSIASDVRLVNRTKIDLQPIHDWQAAKDGPGSSTNSASTGERPLKHWKDIAVTELVTSIVNPVVVITSTDAAPTTVMLRNCPPRLVAKLTRKNFLLAQLGRASAASRYAAATAEEKRGKASSSYFVSGNAAYVDAVVQEEQRKQDEAAAATAREKLTKANQEAIEAELEELTEEIKVEGKLLAMATGGAYGGFPLWDTGLGAK